MSTWLSSIRSEKRLRSRCSLCQLQLRFSFFAYLSFCSFFSRLMKKISLLGLCHGNSQRLGVPGDDLVALFHFFKSLDVVANGNPDGVTLRTFEFHLPL